MKKFTIKMKLDTSLALVPNNTYMVWATMGDIRVHVLSCTKAYFKENQNEIARVFFAGCHFTHQHIQSIERGKVIQF